MKKNLFLLLCVVTLSCCHDKKEDIPKNDILTVIETEIQADSKHNVSLIHILSKIDWTISDIPDWCRIDEVEGSLDKKIYIVIERNSTLETRTATLKISGKNIEVKLPIIQEGLKSGDSFCFPRFSVNYFQKSSYTIGDNGELIATVGASTLAVNPSIKDKIYVGNIIGGSLQMCTDIKEFKEYTNNPIEVFSYYPPEFYREEWTEPSKVQTDAMASKIIKNQPEKKREFWLGSPKQFGSYRELTFWSMGNIGIDMSRLISGGSYKEKEMTKRTGFLYEYSQSLFNITADFPKYGKLINEKLDKSFIKENDLLYILSVDYGRVAYLIVETDDNEKVVDELVEKVTKGESLTNDEISTLATYNICYFYYTSDNEIHMEKGDNVTTIKAYVDGVSKNAIVPISFHAINIDNSSDYVKYSLTIP